MRDDIPWAQLTSLVSGALDAEQERRLLAWAAEHPARQALVQELRHLWTLSAAARQPWDAEAAIQRVKTKAAEQAQAVPSRRPYGLGMARPRHLLRRALAAAAIVGVVLGGLWAVRGGIGTTGPAAPVAQVEHATTRGQRLALRLPDGTAVMLGPESALRHAVSYGDTARVVELRGQAYFDVVHDAARPFVVRTEHALARDLGTKFVVRARHGEAAVDVAVAEGRVALDRVVLDAGDVGRVTADGRTAVHRDAPLDLHFAWTEGRLVYDQVPLATVVADLSRWYDVDIRLTDPDLGRRLLTASFRDQPVVEVLEMIRASFAARLSREGRQFILSRR